MNLGQILRRSSRLSNNCNLKVNGRDYLSRRLGCSVERLEEWMQSATVQPYLQEWYILAVTLGAYYDKVVALIHNGRFYPGPAQPEGDSHIGIANDFEADILTSCMKANKRSTSLFEWSKLETMEGWSVTDIWAGAARRVVHYNRAAGQCFQYWPDSEDCHAFVIDLLSLAFHSIVHRGLDSRYHTLIGIPHTPRLIKIEHLNATLPAYNSPVPHDGSLNQSYLITGSEANGGCSKHGSHDVTYEVDEENSHEEDSGEQEHDDGTYTEPPRAARPRRRRLYNATREKLEHSDPGNETNEQTRTNSPNQKVQDQAGDSILINFVSEEESPENEESPELVTLSHSAPKQPPSNQLIHKLLITSHATTIDPSSSSGERKIDDIAIESPTRAAPKRKASRQLLRTTPDTSTELSEPSNSSDLPHQLPPPLTPGPARRSSRLVDKKQKDSIVSIPATTSTPRNSQLRTPDPLPSARRVEAHDRASRDVSYHGREGGKKIELEAERQSEKVEQKMGARTRVIYCRFERDRETEEHTHGSVQEREVRGMTSKCS